LIQLSADPLGGEDQVLRSAITIWFLASVLCGGCSTATKTADEWIPCSFVPIEDEARDIISQCAHRNTAGNLVVEPIALAVLAMRGVDPAAVTFGANLHYLNAAGVAVPVLPFDNGPDYFIEGLARTVHDGKVGFINKSLAVVIPPSWDFAFPFENGAAIVCDGCEVRPAGHEHGEVVGGRWGVIDSRGQVVVPVTHPRDALRTVRGQ